MTRREENIPQSLKTMGNVRQTEPILIIKNNDFTIELVMAKIV